MKKFQNILQTIALLLLFFTVWLQWPWELDTGPMIGANATVVPDYHMRQARYVSVRESKKDIEFYSDQAIFDLLNQVMTSDDVTIYFYNPEEEKTKVTAKHGKFLMEQRRFYLDGNVFSESPDGFHLKSEEAFYELPTRILTLSQPLYGESKDGNLKIWSDKGKSFLNTNIVELSGNVRTHHKEKKQGLTKIDADRAELHKIESMINYFFHVKVVQREITATGNTASLFYSKEPNSVKYMSINDDVKIVAKDGRHTRSQVAEFFAPTDTVVLSGFPALYDGDDAVTGDKITLYRTTGVVEVTATNAAGTESEAVPRSSTSEDDELIP